MTELTKKQSAQLRAIARAARVSEESEKQMQELSKYTNELREEVRDLMFARTLDEDELLSVFKAYVTAERYTELVLVDETDANIKKLRKLVEAYETANPCHFVHHTYRGEWVLEVCEDENGEWVTDKFVLGPCKIRRVSPVY